MRKITTLARSLHFRSATNPPMLSLYSPFSSSSNNNKNKPFGDTSTQPNFGDQKMTSRDGVFIDQERIRAKMKQIQQRGQVQEEQKKKKQKSQFMKNYKINKDESKVKKFRKDTDTERLMQFEDLSLDEKPTCLQVTSVTNQYIEIDQFEYPPSVIITPHQAYLWEVSQPESITPAHLKFLQIVTPVPTYVIVGVSKPEAISNEVQKYLKSLKIDFSILGVFQAISNYNNYSNNDVQIMAFINSTSERF